VSEPQRLQKAVESMHGGSATLAQSVPVRETFDGKPVWEGVVHVFDLTGHPDRNPRLRLVLAESRGAPNGNSSLCCISRQSIARKPRVRAAIVQEQRGRK
jgi:hypothetical protein